MIGTTARHKRIAPVCCARGYRAGNKIPTSEHARKLVHVGLGIRRERCALRITFRRAIKVKLFRPYRKQLQYFAGKVSFGLVLVLSRMSRYSPIAGLKVISCNKVR